MKYDKSRYHKVLGHRKVLKESGFIMKEKNRMSDLYFQGKGEIL